MRTTSSVLFAATTFAVALLGYACGSSGGSSADLVGKCTQVCEKEKGCDPLFGQVVTDCKAFCQQTVSSSSGGSSGKTCKDEAAATAKLDQCLKVECTALEACFESIDTICGDTSSTGGVSGSTGGATGATGGISGATGGVSGATGGAGGASGVDCTKAYNCCVGYVATLGAPASTCDSIKSQSTTACQAAFAQYSVLASNVPACK